MYPVKNSASNTPLAIFRITPRAAIKLVLVCLMTITVPYALYVRVDSKNTKATIPTAASGRANSYLNVKEGQALRADYRGEQSVTQAMQSGEARARALTSTDIDGDATPDLLAGYTYGNIGIVTIQRGNPEAFAPKDESVYQRMHDGYNPSSLLPAVDTYQVPAAADFVQAGDFNNDSRKDVVLGAQGGDLYFLAGDGEGNLAAPQQVSLPGVVTALTAGEFRAPDGRTDLAVAVDSANGPQVLIYDGADGITGEPMHLSIASRATGLEFGEMDGYPFMGLAVASGSEIEIIHGWGRKTSPALESRVEKIDTGMNIRGLAAGFFVWSREGSNQVAALGDDGTIRVFGQGQLNTQPLSEDEITARGRMRLQPKNTTPIDVEKLTGWQASEAKSWTKSRELVTGKAVGTNGTAQNLLRGADVSFSDTDDLMVLGGSTNLEIINQIDTAKGAPSGANLIASDFAMTSLEAADTPATLALPLKLNGWRDVVVMQSGSTAATLVPLAPTATITVDRTDDPAITGSGVGAAACTGGANDCSLRGAVEFANSNSGTVISLSSATYVLTTNGTNGCLNENSVTGNRIGDLEVNATTTINGTGAANSIIRQGSAVNDRVFCLDVPLAAGRTYTFSGLTITGGRDNGSNVGGGGIIGGAKGSTLSLTNVTFANNQTTGPATSGGGGVGVTGGDMTVTTCTFGAANTPTAASSKNDLTLGNLANSLSGGGIDYSAGDPLGTNGATGTLTITGTTFTHNASSSVSSGGGGLSVYEFNTSVGTGNISTSAFTTNSTTGTASGGGIMNQSMNSLTIATTSFTTNAANNQGGGIYVAGGNGTFLNGTNPSITFSGNTAAGNSCGCTFAGSSISAAGAVTLSGTNTTIGGDLVITTNGAWTNSAGSAMSPTNFIMTGTANFTGNNSTVNVGGNFNFGSGTFSAGTSTFNFNGSAPAQSITNASAITFFNLTDSNTTNPLTLNNSFAVSGTLTVNANTILDPVAAAVISGSGTLTGSGTARVRALGGFSPQYTITNKTLTNLTVEYIGAGAQTGSAITYGPLKINNASGVNLAAGTTTVNGQLTLTAGALGVGTQTLVINNGTTLGAGSITSSATGTVNYNQSSAGQDVRAFNYGNLTFSAFTKILANAGTIGIAGTFNVNGITTGHTITGSTIDFNGTGAQTVPVFNFNNLTISGARTTNSVTLINGGTIGIAGTFAPTATFTTGNYIVTNNTVDFNGAGAQTIPAFNYNNLTISGNRAVAITLGNGNVGVAGVFNPSITGNTWTANPTNTVVFNGAALQTIPAFAFFNGLTLNNAAGANLGGDVTVLNSLTLTAGALAVGTNTLTLNGAASAAAGSLTSAATGTVNYNQQSNGQATVLAANYGNLTFSNFNKTLASTGTIGIAGTFTPGSATGHTITGSTINFNGAGAQTIPGFTYNNLTSTGAVARTLDPVNTIKIAGVFTPGASTYTITGSTVEYNGSAAQTLPSTFTTYNNLTLNNPTTTLGFAGLTVQGLLRVQAGTFTSSSTYNNVQIDTGATLAGTNATTINVSGNWTNNGGTFTPNGNIVNFNGGAGQTIGGTSAAQTFNDVIVNKTGTLDVGGSTTALTLHNLTLTTGTFAAGTAATINCNGNWTNNGGTFTPGTGTVNFNAGVAQTIGGTATTQTFQGFTVNKAGGSSLSVIASTNTLDINGNVTLTLGNFTAGTATAITVAGNWTNNGGSFTGGSGTVTFDGGAGQSVGGTTATTFNNLTNGNANGLAMSFDNTVNGALALTSSDITVAATRTLTQPFTATSSGAFDVNGRVKRTGFITNGAALSFGNPFNTIQVTSGTALDIVVDLARTVPVGFATAVQRTYTITPNPTGITGTLRLHYLDSELNGNVEGPNFIFRRFETGLGWRPVLATSSDFVNNWLEATGVSQFSPWTFNSTFTPTAAPGVISGRITDNNGNAVAGAVVRLSGTQNRKFITDADGYYRFENVEASGFYTVTPTRANYTFSPAERSFTQNAQSTDAAFGATAVTTGLVNPLDTAEYFVRQQYLDFLGREPDESGFNFWSDQILACGADAACVDFTRQNVSAAYFFSIEFQGEGGLVDALYRASFGAAPQYSAFVPDAKAIGAGVVVGKEHWQETMEANKQAFVANFVNRDAFRAAYDGMTNADYVDALISHTGVSFAADERDALVNGLAANTMTRAGVLRSIAENNRFVSAKQNEMFVMMEYFGYLHRQPDAAGYAYWLDKLNQFGGNFQQAEMVRSFVVSDEYRDRFPR